MKRTPVVLALLCPLLTVVSDGCGSGNSGGPGNGAPPSVVFTFDKPSPVAAAVQIGGGNFQPTPINGGTLGVTLPSGVSNYSIAYVCPPARVNQTETDQSEVVVEANIQDGTSFNVTCNGVFLGPGPNLASATGGVSTTAIAGAAGTGIDTGTDNTIFSTGITDSSGAPVTNGPFSVKLPSGTYDLAFDVFDTTGTMLAVKILHQQTIPGTLNGGSNIVFQPGDMVTTQPLTVNNVPAGSLVPPVVEVSLVKAGLSFSVDSNVPQSQFFNQYLVMPAAAVNSGDFYNFRIITLQGLQTSQNVTGGGPVTISLPAPFVYAGPSPATFPTFTFNYSGFPKILAQQASIGWRINQGNPFNGVGISVTASANFQNGANTIVIPNLTSLSGFLAMATSGTSVSWGAQIWGGTAQPFQNILLGGSPPPDNGGMLSTVTASGSYTEP